MAASSKSIQYSNCEILIPKINCTHKWIIPKFESWSLKNPGQLLNGPLFFPTQGIQLQLKILGSQPTSNRRVFLVNKNYKAIYLSNCFLQYFLCTKNNELYSSKTEVKPDHELAISDEFKLPLFCSGYWESTSSSICSEMKLLIGGNWILRRCFNKVCGQFYPSWSSRPNPEDRKSKIPEVLNLIFVPIYIYSIKNFTIH